MRLPGWVTDNRTAVKREVAPYEGIAAAESWKLVAQASALGVAQLRWDPNPAESLAHRDPLSPSAADALRRLRQQARKPS